MEGTYSGELRWNEPHGKGVWEHPDGAYYEGEWYEGMMHGEGLVESGGRPAL